MRLFFGTKYELKKCNYSKCNYSRTKGVQLTPAIFFFFWKVKLPLHHDHVTEMGIMLPQSLFCSTSLILQFGWCARAWQEKRPEFKILALLAFLARLSATLPLYGCRALCNFFAWIISYISAMIGRMDQCPGWVRGDPASTAKSSTWLSVNRVASCRLRAAASFAPKSRAWASASNGSRTCGITTWKKETWEILLAGLVRMQTPIPIWFVV
jgi:hypothetical protein